MPVIVSTEQGAVIASQLGVVFRVKYFLSSIAVAKSEVLDVFHTWGRYVSCLSDLLMNMRPFSFIQSSTCSPLALLSACLTVWIVAIEVICLKHSVCVRVCVCVCLLHAHMNV